jgi:hypothetical protein
LALHRKVFGFKNKSGNVVPDYRLAPHITNKRGTTMLKIAALSGALAVGLISGAYAQNTGPAAQTDNMNKPGMTNSNSDAVRKSPTTGAASSGGGSTVTTTGNANGSPSSMPTTTTGPTGAPSKDEAPAR